MAEIPPLLDAWFMIDLSDPKNVSRSDYRQVSDQCLKITFSTLLSSVPAFL